MPEMVYIIAFFAFAFCFQSLFGFGGSFIVVLGLSLFISTEIVIGMLPIPLIAVTAAIVIRDFKDVCWRAILISFLMSVPGVFFGVFLLESTNPDIIIIAVTLLILFNCIYSLVVNEVNIPVWMHPPLLIVSGIVIGGTGLGITYVPVIMQKIKGTDQLRVSMNFLWFFLAVLRLPLYLSNNIITPDYALKGAIAIPASLAAVFLGRMIHRKFKAEVYRKSMLIVLAIITFSRLVLSVRSLII